MWRIFYIYILFKRFYFGDKIFLNHVADFRQLYHLQNVLFWWQDLSHLLQEVLNKIGLQESYFFNVIFYNSFCITINVSIIFKKSSNFLLNKISLQRILHIVIFYFLNVIFQNHICIKRHFLGTSNSKWGNRDYVSTIKLRYRESIPELTFQFPRFTNRGTKMLYFTFPGVGP